jgi:type II secretory pathway pseudopilin PulG
MRPVTVLKKSIVFSRQTEGQLLVEMMVALGVSAILTTAASIALVSLLRYNFENQGQQNASALASSLMNAVSSFAENRWHNIYDLNKTSASHYYLVSAPTSSVAVPGDESVFFNDVEAGLIGHWKFDESTGMIAYDSSGNSAGGSFSTTSVPTRLTSSSCYANGCVAFNDNTQYITSPAVPYGHDVSFSLWFLSASSSQDLNNWNYWVQSYYGANGIEFGTWGNGIVFKDNGASIEVDGGSVPNDNLWHHAVGVIGGSNMQVWLDGELKGATSLYPANVARSSFSFNDIGGSHVNNTRGWYGSLDDVRIYNRALSASEISLLYKNQSYSRYFYVDNVSRDGSGNVTTSSGTGDPSTQMIHTGVLWKEGRTMTMGQYITRAKETALFQNNWQGGSGQTGPYTGRLTGYDTASNIVAGQTVTLATTTASGTLVSSIFDTQDAAGGAAINSLLWQGSLNGGTVKFQFAYATSSSGPWNFYGPGASPSAYYQPTNSGVPLAITGINNYRYFRYKIFLTPSGTSAPTVSSVSVAWSW